MSKPLSPQPTHRGRRLFLLPSANSGICAQTLEMADILRQDGFQVDILGSAGELPDFLLQASQAQQTYCLALMGLGISPAGEDLEKLRLLWRRLSEAFVIACAAEFPGAWETKARDLDRKGQLFLLDNPVDALMLRRLAASLLGIYEKNEKMRNKLERMEHTVAACAHEISRRKEAEQEASSYATAVESANRALEEFCAATEAATKAKSEFLANMSHEIRTPMTAILGFAEELLEPGLTEKERLAAAATIQRNGQHLLSIINDILDFSKIEAGKMEIEHIECSPNQIVEDVYSLMEERARRKYLQFKLCRLAEVPEIIESDPTRIRQILINLVGNAIKFTSSGTVKILYGLQQQENDDLAIFFEVKDTGIGMTGDHMDRLFVPFMQADSSTTRRYGGSGLGLSICKHLVDKLGGRISVESSLGEGSTFRVSLPIRVAIEKAFSGKKPFCEKMPADKNDLHKADSQVAPQLPSGEELSGLKILVAEDAPDNQRLIEKILNKAGSTVVMAGNGLAAVEMARKEMHNGRSFDLILMDIQMPVLDGYQATVRLREDGFTGPIIALTAHAMGSEVEKTLQAGCNAYLAKPFTRQGLLSAISRAAKGREKTPQQ